MINERATATKQPAESGHQATGVLQRACACGRHSGSGGECAECRKKRLGLQRRAVRRDSSETVLLNSPATVSPLPRFSHDFTRIPNRTPTHGIVQTNLTINKPGDEYEQEADRIAARVLAMPPGGVASEAPLRIQRFARGPSGQPTAAPASVGQALATHGRPLDPQLRQDMELRFGQDFSQVRVHTDTLAAQSARDVNANAYTVGSDIVFDSTRYAPGTHAGQKLIAHELTHVVQQSEGLKSFNASTREWRGALAPSRRAGHRMLQRDTVDLQAQFNRAVMAADWDMAVRALVEMSEADAWQALLALDSNARAELRIATLRLDPTPGNRLAHDIDYIERGPDRHAGQSESPSAAPTHEVTPPVNIASLGAVDKLGRAWGHTQERLATEVINEVANLFSPASLAMMAAFAIAFLAAQLTPVGWIADAFALATLTLTAIFVGALVFEIARDIYRFFSAVNATSEDELRTSGYALAHALARGGVGIFIALLTRGMRGATRPPTPPASAVVTVEVVAAGVGRVRVPATVTTVSEAVATTRLQGLASYAVMVPPPGGSSPSSPSATSSSGGGGSRGQAGPGAAAGSAGFSLGRVLYGTGPLSQLAQRMRLILGLRRGGNVAVFEFENIPPGFRALVARLGGRNVHIEGNRMAVQNVSGSAHSEALAHELIITGRRAGIELNVRRIYTEYNPCTDTCLPLIREQYPSAEVTYSFIWERWGRQAPDRNAAVDALFSQGGTSGGSSQ